MLLRRLLQLALSGILALAGLLWALQTPTGFQHIIIPILAFSDLGTLQAAHGELDLRGKLVLTDAHYQHEDAGIDVSLQSGSLSLDLLSLFGNQPIAIDTVALADGILTIQDSPDNAEAENLPNPLEDTIEAIAEDTSLALPVTLRSGTLDNFTYRQVQQNGESVIQAESLSLENLAANQNAQLNGQLRWKSSTSTRTTDVVTVAINAELDLNEKAAPSRWSLQANANQTSDTGPDAASTGTLSLTIDGNHENDDQLKASINLAGERSGKTFGKLEGQLALTGLSGASLIQSLGIETETQIHTLSLGPLFSFLPPDSSRPEMRGELHGSIGASGKLAGPLTINTDVAILGLEVEGSPVPTRQLRIGLQTTSNLEQNGDFLEIAELKVELGDGHLRAHGEASPAEASFSIQIDANEFPIASLLALGGLDTAAEFGALPVNGKIEIKRESDGAASASTQSRLAVLLPGTKTPELFDLKGAVTSPAKGPIKANVSASQPNENGDVVIQATVDKTTDVAIKIADMDLTALVQPFLEAKPVHAPASAPVDKIPLPQTDADTASEATSASDAGDQADETSPMKIRLDMARTRYREVEVGTMTVDADLDQGETHIKIAATEFSKGTMAFTLDLANTGPVRMEWKGNGEGIRLKPLMDAFAGSTTVGGRLKFKTQGLSKESAPEPAINGLDGIVNLHLRDGKLKGFEALDMLARATGVNLLGAFAFSSLDGKIQIEDGVAHVKKLEAGGAAGNIRVAGQVDLREEGLVDLRLNPRIGPSIARFVKGIKPLKSVVNTAEGLLSLPINIVITGPLTSPKYAVQSQSASEAISSRGGKLVGGLLNELTLGGSSKVLGALLPSQFGEAPATPPTPEEKP